MRCFSIQDQPLPEKPAQPAHFAFPNEFAKNSGTRSGTVPDRNGTSECSGSVNYINAIDSFSVKMHKQCYQERFPPDAASHIHSVAELRSIILVRLAQ